MGGWLSNVCWAPIGRFCKEQRDDTGVLPGEQCWPGAKAGFERESRDESNVACVVVSVATNWYIRRGNWQCGSGHGGAAWGAVQLDLAVLAGLCADRGCTSRPMEYGRL